MLELYAGQEGALRSFIFNTVFIGMKSQGTFVRESSMLSLAMYYRESIINCLPDSKEDQTKRKRCS